MAKASWCNVSPMSGKGNGTLTISAGAHGGRVARSTTVTVTAVNGTKPSKTIAVSQAGAGTVTTMDSSKPAVPATGGTVTINGTSTSSKLRWKIPARAGTLQIVDLLTASMYGVTCAVTVNGGAITSDAAIAGDPGASGRYNFVATVTFSAAKFPVNTTVNFTVIDDTGAEKVCTFTWNAGASTLSLDKSSLSLVNGGTGQTVNVTSNDDWNVS